MNENSFNVIFKIDNPNGETDENLRKNMESEFIDMYNMYASMCNSGVTNMLNSIFEDLNPNYFEDNKDKELCELVEYNKFMAKGWQHIVNSIVDTHNFIYLDFYVESEEAQLIGCLKDNHDIKIQMFFERV